MLNNNDNHIYKFMPFGVNALKSLIKNELWFGSPHNLNDPFESKFKINHEGTLPNDNFLIEYYKETLSINEAIIERLNRNKANIKFLIEDIEEAIQTTIRNRVGICSFSKRNDDVRMWAHYADSHNGICLIFDKEKLLESFRNHVSVNELFVSYKKELPSIDIIFEENNIIKRNLDFKEITKRKLKSWKYEEEIRYAILSHNDNPRRNIPFEKDALIGVILGHGIQRDDVSTLFHLFNSRENFLWAKTVKNHQTAKMDIIDFKPRFFYNQAVF